ncbi:MAG: cyclic nucleotide-binding domain-containing protein [Anaerolinea sp.]|nr:cyclic nucleotide-binding domain-containing protein [Anaerolinea sp.]
MTNRDDFLRGLLGSDSKRKTSTEPTASGTPESSGGLTPLDLLALPAKQRKIVNWLSRKKQASLNEMMAALGPDQTDLEAQLQELIKAEYIQETRTETGVEYRVVFRGTVRRGPVGLSSEIWSKVDLDHMTFLKQVPLFRGLGEDQLREVAGMLGERRFQRGEVILTQGGASEHVYLIKNGIAGVDRAAAGGSPRKTVSFMRQGDMFGESSLLPEPGSISPTYVTALTPMDTVMLKRSDLFALMQKYPGIAIELSRALVGRLIATDTHFSAVMGMRMTLVIGVGLEVGATSVGAMIALALADRTQIDTVYTELPDAHRLAGPFGVPPVTETLKAPGGYSVVVNPGFSGLNVPLRNTLIYESLVNRFRQIVIGVPSWADDIIDLLVCYADQVVIITTPTEEARDRLEKFNESFRLLVTDTSRLLYVLNRSKAEHKDLAAPAGMDFDLPFVDNMIAPAQLTPENLKPGIKQLVDALADRLGAKKP